MVIDCILDRYEGSAYDPKDFYDMVSEYGFHNIARALDSGTELDVKKELCSYILNDYNPYICRFILGVDWLTPDNGKDYNSIISIRSPFRTDEN